ncbi:hypothetical protein KCP73_05315 [Salmonella enterica subsp. enterica]|nr:hypothetical protein KCP73_05315 [Salmonella enterica subsp. enterica]
MTLGTKFVIADNPQWWQAFPQRECLDSGNERRRSVSADWRKRTRCWRGGYTGLGRLRCAPPGR